MEKAQRTLSSGGWFPWAVPATGAAAVVAAVFLPSIGAQSSPSATTTVMDRPIALLEQSRAALARVADYECTQISQERVNGKLLPVQVATVRARQQPFSVYMRFESPDRIRGQEVCYVEGRNRGMMRIHPAGWRGIVGFVSIDPRDPRVFEESRHPITDAGLWSMADATARYWDGERRANKTMVRIGDCPVDGRPCTWIETTHPDPDGGSCYAYRCLLWLDDETHLPVRNEAYDRPKAGGAPYGDLIECYVYRNVRCNAGHGRAEFDY